jgi:pimeloyl-ACP methyl ester carboxylesterase
MGTRDRRVRTPEGRSLRITEGGDPGGCPIIMLHGIPLSGRLYRPHLEYARDRGIRLISYDRPGYAGSDALPGRNVAQAAQDVSFVADRLGLSRLGVWGYSGGGNHALACGALLPERVTAVAAAGAMAPYGAPGLDWFAGLGSSNVDEFRAALAGRDAIEGFLRPQWLALQKNGGVFWPDLMTLLSPGDLELLQGELGKYLGAATIEALVPGFAGWTDDDLAHVAPWGFVVGAPAAPTSIWHGKSDRFVPYSHSVWLSEHLPGSELMLFDDETHLTIFERRFPEILEWLVDRGRANGEIKTG